MNKASFQDKTVAQTGNIVLADLIAAYDYKHSKSGVMKKYWIQLSKYWKGVNGQKWLSTNVVSGGAPEGYIPNGNTPTVATDNFTAFIMETQDIDDN